MTHNLPFLYKRLGEYGKIARQMIADSTRASILALADLCEDYLPVSSTEEARRNDIEAWRTIAEFLPVVKGFFDLRKSKTVDSRLYRNEARFPVMFEGVEIAKLEFSVSLRPGHAQCRAAWIATGSPDYRGRDWFDYINYKRLGWSRKRLDIARGIEFQLSLNLAGYSGYMASVISQSQIEHNIEEG